MRDITNRSPLQGLCAKAVAEGIGAAAGGRDVVTVMKHSALSLNSFISPRRGWRLRGA